MFEERLRIVFILFSACWLVVVIRLFQLQVVEAEHYQLQAESRLVRGTRSLVPIRGRLLDRNGQVLASDEPSWSIGLDYRLLDPNPEYLDWLAQRVRNDDAFLRRHAAEALDALPVGAPGLSQEDLTEELAGMLDGHWVQARVGELWDLLCRRFAPVDVATVEQEVHRQIERIQRWKEAYVRTHNLPEHEAEGVLLREEQTCLPVIRDLGHDQHIDAQLLLMDRYDWLLDAGAVEIRDSRRRMYHDGEPLAHVLGHLREATPEDIERYPYRADGRIVHRDGYQERDWVGASGVEAMYEERLRGQRGWLRVFYDERPPERIDPQHGQDVRLTLDQGLQREVYALLEHSVAEVSDDYVRQAGFTSPVSPAGGGSVVVLDIPTREVLAMVSYPAFDPNEYYDLIGHLSLDVRRFPLHFRAVYSQYAPGSIVKPITVAAALGAGIIEPATLLECQGKLFPENPRPAFRCWRPAGSSTPLQHGLIDSRQAIKGSCNVFCYKVGRLFCERSGSTQMGVQRMCEWLDLFGAGRRTGIGLAEEAKGILPTPHYLATTKNRSVNPADARFYAIGQGELQVTPLQAANIAAIYGSGVNRSVTLMIEDPRERPLWKLPVREDVWRIVREGMYGVVNEIGGTARKTARLEHPDYVLCGKSGSAETRRWTTDYRVDYRRDEDLASVVVQADNRANALLQFQREHEDFDSVEAVTPVGFWPPHRAEAGRKFSHAWFIGFVQPRGSHGEPDWSAPARIAIAVLLEFGGSGGVASGPLCRDVAATVIEKFPHYLRGGPAWARGPS